ncbi:Unknown protein [Striga hermonthica]|uniref:BHLH domain-containing protein n=1 Tax=Striga hermonthica TaxID=68872 RepID=A0A9N7NK14_STRHE|nr:Unknown protein [Striga hermonthica]
MGSSLLRSLLQTFCFNSPWNYAVFWKLKHQHEMVLLWEDGFCDTLKLRNHLGNSIEDLCLENSKKIMPSIFSSSTFDFVSGEYPIELALVEMSSASHVVGKGVVGKSAYTGSASWIYSNNILTNMSTSVSVHEDEWLLQFAAGIKTVLLLPVMPHGVLQLGSVEMVAEDAALVARVKNQFEAQITLSLYGSGFSAFNSPDDLNESSDNKYTTFLPVQDFGDSDLSFVADMLEKFSKVDFGQQQTLPTVNGAEPSQPMYEDHGPFMTENDLFLMDFPFGEGESIFESAFCDFDFEPNRLPMIEMEAPVANPSRIPDDNSSNKSSITSSENLSSPRKYDKSEKSAQVREYEVPCDLSASELAKVSEFSDEQRKRNKLDSVDTSNLSKLPITKKRKACNGNIQRPKPRDRQLMNERLKELRDLVPNSENCSIDGLLDKTIKHMLFLRNVTERADKLRHHHKEELDEEKTRKPADLEKGKSWAVELGSEKLSCPIVVKDLDHPGQMMIQMVCTDCNGFLEIADVIHRLELTILEGTMEKSTDGSWQARFIVETTGNFHRLEIFWPLMKLVQQNGPPSSSSI